MEMHNPVQPLRTIAPKPQPVPAPLLVKRSLPPDPRDWSIDDTAVWLDTIGCWKYIPHILQHKISGSVLLANANKEYLIRLGVDPLHTNIILSALDLAKS